MELITQLALLRSAQVVMAAIERTAKTGARLAPGLFPKAARGLFQQREPDSIEAMSWSAQVLIADAIKVVERKNAAADCGE